MNQYYFTTEISNMMHAFGDCSQPMQESAQLTETIVHEQMTSLIAAAINISRKRGSDVIDAEDILFLLRKDKLKLARLINHLYVKDIRASISDGTSIKTELRDAMRGQGNKRVRVCFEHMSKIDEFGEYKKVFNQALCDEIKNQRLRRIDSMTKNMSHEEYLRFSRARQVSFTSKTTLEAFSEWLLSASPNVKISVFAFEMIQYLCHETVAQVVDLALLVKQDQERTSNDALSVLVTKSNHNHTDRVKLSNLSYPSQQNVGLRISANDQPEHNRITPDNIYEALRRYCEPFGFNKEYQVKNKRHAIVLLCV